MVRGVKGEIRMSLDGRGKWVEKKSQKQLSVEKGKCIHENTTKCCGKKRENIGTK